MSLNRVIWEMQQVSVADIRQASREQRAKFETVAHGIIACINAENAYDDEEEMKRGLVSKVLADANRPVK